MLPDEKKPEKNSSNASYPCPKCGQMKLHFPDVKGEWGYKDTTKYICYGCWSEYDRKTLDMQQKKDGPLDREKG